MIKTLILENFQSHKNTEIGFLPGVNVIVGRSDVGKSTILRALSWALFNTPDGLDMIRHGQKICKVVIVFHDGTIIQRNRSKAKNEYVLEVGDQQYKFSGFGRSVPDEIKKVVNMQEINISSQFSQFFLLSDSSGEVARKLNKIARLDLIDKVIKYVNKEIRQNKSELSHWEDLKQQKEKEVESFDFLPGLKKDINRVEKIENKLSNLTNKRLNVLTLYNDIQERKKALKSLNFALTIKSQIKDAEKIYLDIELDKERSRKLSTIVDDLWHYKEEKKTLDRELKEYKAKLKNIMPEICPLCGGKISEKAYT